MTVMLEHPSPTTFRDPRELLNAVRPHVRECTYNVFESAGSELSLWEREIRLMMRDNVMVRDMAQRILGNAVAYAITAMERPDLHLGVGKIVDTRSSSTPPCTSRSATSTTAAGTSTTRH